MGVTTSTANAGATYVPIQSTTLSAETGTVTFSSIPSTYTDLVLVSYMKPNSGGNNNANVRFNSDSGSNYSLTYLYGDGSSPYSGRSTNSTTVGYSIGNTNGSNEPIVIQNIMNYSNTTTYKTVLNRNNAAGGWAASMVGMWRSTSAINRIDITTTNTNFGIGSTFVLYGIKAA